MEDDKKLFAAALIIIFGGNATGIINAVNPDIRADPFTGTQGTALEDRIHDLEVWKHNHVIWGREAHGRHDANIKELYRRLP